MEQMRKIDLVAVGGAILRKAWLLVILALVFGAVAFAYTDYFVKPMYQASVTIYVNNTSYEQSSAVSAANLATAQRLVTTYVTMIKSNTVLEKVSEEVGGKVSAGAIRGMMTAQSMNETEVFRVNITCGNPELAAEIANAVAKVAPAEISYFVNGSSTKIVDYAKVPGAPVSPNIVTNTAIGAVLGICLAVVIVLLRLMLDNRIKDEMDLQRISPVPVLGTIPNFKYESKNDYDYEYSREE